MLPSICPQVCWSGVSRLILGSKSWSRNTLLQQLDPPTFDVIVADIDERAVSHKPNDARDMVLQIALAKARKLMSLPQVINHTPLSPSPAPTIASSPSSPAADDEEVQDEKEGRVLMICGDALVVHKDKIFGKPKSVEDAKSLLSSYKDAPVTTVSSILIVDVFKKCYWYEIDEAEVYFRELPPQIVDKVIENGGMQSAGALRIEMPEVQPYIESIVGDISAVMGFSQPVLAKLINELLVDDSNAIKLE